MRCFVDISQDNAGKISACDGKATIRISAEMNGETHVREYTEEVTDETPGTLAIRAVVTALKKFNREGQEIIFRMNHPYMYARFEYLERWHRNGYRGRNGKKVENEMEWRQIWMKAQKNKLSFEYKP